MQYSLLCAKGTYWSTSCIHLALHLIFRNKEVAKLVSLSSPTGKLTKSQDKVVVLLLFLMPILCLQTTIPARVCYFPMGSITKLQYKGHVNYPHSPGQSRTKLALKLAEGWMLHLVDAHPAHTLTLPLSSGAVSTVNNGWAMAHLAHPAKPALLRAWYNS